MKHFLKINICSLLTLAISSSSAFANAGPEYGHFQSPAALKAKAQDQVNAYLNSPYSLEIIPTQTSLQFIFKEAGEATSSYELNKLKILRLHPNLRYLEQGAEGIGVGLAVGGAVAAGPLIALPGFAGALWAIVGGISVGGTAGMSVDLLSEEGIDPLAAGYRGNIEKSLILAVRSKSGENIMLFKNKSQLDRYEKQIASLRNDLN